MQTKESGELGVSKLTGISRLEDGLVSSGRTICVGVKGYTLGRTLHLRHLAQTSIVQRAWKNEQRPIIHGWVYDLRTGYVKETACMEPGAKMDEIYDFDFDGTT